MSEHRDFTPPEVRFVTDAPEFRMADDTSSGHIVGYAASFNKLSRRLGGFHERVLPDAFTECRAAGWPNVVCRYNHAKEFVLGTTAAGTCSINVDERGLQYDVKPPKTRADVLELVQRGDVRYSSFAFRASPDGGDTWTQDDNGYPLRELRSVELIDVAPVLDPAYFDTSASARNFAGAIESLARWADADPEEVRSMMEEGNVARFVKRTDRSSVPVVSPSEAEQREQEAKVSANSTDNNEEESVETEGTPEITEEERKALDTKARNALPDSAFAYIDENGQRHFPIHDKEHVQKALQLGPRSPMWSKAKGKVLAAAKKYGVSHEEQNGFFLEALEIRLAELPELEELRAAKANYDDLHTCGECGAKGEYNIHCSQCGAAMRDKPSSDKFCTSCGHKLTNPRTTTGATGDEPRSNEEEEHEERSETPEGEEARGLSFMEAQAQMAELGEKVHAHFFE